MKKPITALLKEIKTLATSGARIASLLYTAKGTGEVARHTVVLGVSIEKAYKRDIKILTAKRATLSGVALVACDEMIASLQESLTKGIGNNDAYTCKGVYEQIANGMKLHIENVELHISGFSIGKTVLVEGVYKHVNSSAKTLAKKALKKCMKSGNFRQYAVAELETVRMNGNVIAFE